MEKIPNDGMHAARAVAQWLLGDPGWATRLIGVAFADDPIGAAKIYIEEDAFEQVWQESAR